MVEIGKRCVIGFQNKRKLLRWTAEIGANKFEDCRRVDELARRSLDKKINNTFSGPWLFHVSQDGILDTDFRKAIPQKQTNISFRINCFVEDDSVSDCIQRFLIKTGADMRFRATSN